MRFAWLAVAAMAAGCSSNTARPPAVNPPPEVVDAAASEAYSREALKQRLTPEQYEVCVFKGTELPFENKYWDHKGDGVYHCVVCGKALFDSATKFDSGTGWPSYYDVLTKGNVKTEIDRSLVVPRIEVMCAECGSHLGHLFDDGPEPTRQRYCINSAALEFRPRDGQTPAKELPQP